MDITSLHILLTPMNFREKYIFVLKRNSRKNIYNIEFKNKNSDLVIKTKNRMQYLKEI